MAHIKNLSNRAYISGSLKDKLSRFEMYRYSFIYAPTGYGKSKVIRTFFKNYEELCITLHCDFLIEVFSQLLQACSLNL